MGETLSNDSMLGIYIFETNNQLEILEQMIISGSKQFTQEEIETMFRIMHTIKGSSGMMSFHNIETLTHKLEDILFIIRENTNVPVNHGKIADHILSSVDYIREEIEKLNAGEELIQEVPSELMDALNTILAQMRESVEEASHMAKGQTQVNKEQYAYTLNLSIKEDTSMLELRLFELKHKLESISETTHFIPTIDDEKNIEQIKNSGIQVHIKTQEPKEQIKASIHQIPAISEIEIVEVKEEAMVQQENQENEQELIPDEIAKKQENNKQNLEKKSIEQRENAFHAEEMMSVSVARLDHIMDLLGEIVIAEAMVIQNPDLEGLQIDNFRKAASQLNKITLELQDQIMTIRMVPIILAFNKMQRIVRDMSKKLNKQVKLNFIGEETQVDKKVIELISDPIIHMVRNAMDHAIELPNERIEKGKMAQGNITLEAKDEGNEVFIFIRDDGRGLSRQGILEKAKRENLLTKPESSMTDQEVFELIFKPGFSTKQEVTEYSGRGVGMDVVVKNIELIGGSITVDSVEGQGTCFTINIPLSMAIIEGMNVKVGNSYFTLPIILIKESFRPQNRDIIVDPEGNEMIIIRGECYPIIKLYEKYKLETSITDYSNGIVIKLEKGDKSICLFVDELLGQQQVVIKNLPQYIMNMGRVEGISGCTLLGDGTISLLLDFEGLVM